MTMKMSAKSKTQVGIGRRQPVTRIRKMNPLSDNELLLSIANDRNKEAFLEYFTRHERHFYNLALRITQNADLATEATQTAMIKIWRLAASFKPEGHASGWATRIVSNEGLMLLRRRRTRKEIRHDPKFTGLTSNCTQPGEFLNRTEEQVALQKLLHSLPANDQRLMALYFGAGQSQDEIAKTLDTSQSNISAQIKKILSKLRVELTQAGFSAALITTTLDDSQSWMNWLQMFDAPSSLQSKVQASAFAEDVIRPEANVKFYSKGLMATLSLLGIAFFGVRAWAPISSTPSEKTQSTAPAQTTLPSVQDSNHTLYRKVFNFDHPTHWKSSLIVREGHVLHIRDSGHQSKGCLASNHDASHIQMKLPGLRFPFKLTIHINTNAPLTRNEVRYDLGAIIYPMTDIVKFNFQQENTIQVAPQTIMRSWKKLEWFFQKEGAEAFSRGKRSYVMCYATSGEPTLVLFMGAQTRFDSIIIEELPAKHFIDLKDFKTVRDQYDRAKHMNRTIMVPGLKKYEHQGAPVTMRFNAPITVTNP